MDTLQKFIDQSQNDMIHTLQRLISIPSVMEDALPNAPFGEQTARALNEMLDICEQAGLQTKNFDNYVGTATWGDDPQLGILCHLDVVPAGEGWVTNPFDCIEKDGKLYGRGTIDDKGPTVAAFYALLAIIKAGFKPKGGVKLIFGTNEENRSADLKYYLTKEKMPPLLFTPDSQFPVVNVEKGIFHLNFFNDNFCENDSMLLSFQCGNVINAIPSQAKAVVNLSMKQELLPLSQQQNDSCSFTFAERENNLHILCEGTPAHAAFPKQGCNPLTALAHLLCKSSLSGKKADLLRKLYCLFPHGDTTAKTAKLACEDKDSGALSLAFTILNINANEFSGCIDIRFAVCQSINEVQTAFTQLLTSIGLQSKTLYASEPHMVSSDSLLVRRLLKAYEEVTGEKGGCIAMGGGTYVHDLDGVAFGPERIGTDYHMHASNEFIPISELLQSAKIYAKAIQFLATKEQ